MKDLLRIPLTLLAAVSLLLAACAGPSGTTAPSGSTASPGGSPSATADSGASPTDGASPSASADTGASPSATSGASESPAGSPDASGTPAGSPSAAACPDTARDQTIDMWSPLTGPDGDEMTALATRFSTENEWGITVNHVPTPDYLTALQTAAASPDQLPDATIVRVINVGELAARNIITPWGADALSVLGDIEGQLAPLPWERGEYNGERYSIPIDFAGLVMYYNKDMFAAANVEEPGTEPWTREEFDAALTALQDSGVQAISIGTLFNSATLFQTFIEQFGGSVVNEDGTQATFNSPEGVEALEYIKTLRDTHGTQASGPNDPEVQPFSAGQAAIVIHGPWHISNLGQLPFTGYAPVPQVGDEFAVWGGSHQLAVHSDDAAIQSAAACWLSWFYENSVAWAAAGQIPAYTPARESADLATQAPGIAAIAPSAAEGVIILPQVPGLEGAVWPQGFEPAIDAILLGQETDIQAALDRQNAIAQQVIDQNAETFGGGTPVESPAGSESPAASESPSAAPVP
ncbi:MAG TPA: extracellular solute-binding protein [Candidatus Limnocylindrales bacterium]|nr:extracellular solute-binding protein [Candidatus Limnocylindrales bacterium]